MEHVKDRLIEEWCSFPQVGKAVKEWRVQTSIEGVYLCVFGCFAQQTAGHIWVTTQNVCYE